MPETFKGHLRTNLKKIWTGAREEARKVHTFVKQNYSVNLFNPNSILDTQLKCLNLVECKALLISTSF